MLSLPLRLSFVLFILRSGCQRVLRLLRVSLVQGNAGIGEFL
jgi:hypothetical protein